MSEITVINITTVQPVTSLDITVGNPASAVDIGVIAQLRVPAAETDPLFSASPAAGITANLILAWNLAFSWGDHAEAGYLKSFAESDPVFSASEAAKFSVGDAAKLAGIAEGAEVNNISDSDASELTGGGETALHSHPGGTVETGEFTINRTDGLISSIQTPAKTWTITRDANDQISEITDSINTWVFTRDEDGKIINLEVS